MAEPDGGDGGRRSAPAERSRFRTGSRKAESSASEFCKLGDSGVAERSWLSGPLARSRFRSVVLGVH